MLFNFFKKRISDPKIIAEDILKTLLENYENKSKLHKETVLSCLGALSGFGCQMAIREAFIKTGKMTEKGAFVVVETKSGEKYFYGDFLNGALIEAKTSVWSLVGGAAQSVGVEKLPDINDICTRTAESIGKESFGKLTVSDEHQPKEDPIESLQNQWHNMYNMIRKYKYDPSFLGWYFALAAQRFIIAIKDEFSPKLAVQITMEAAISMSKVNPDIVAKK